MAEGSPGGRAPRGWWAPGRASWWAGVLFAGGSACFLVGPLRAFAELVGSSEAGVVLFAGSVLFTAASLVQLGQALRGGRADMLPWTPIQLLGALLFNVDTVVELQARLSAGEEVRLVWTPDALGSLCFLAAACLAGAVGLRRDAGRRASGPRRRAAGGAGRRAATLGALNVAGSMAFVGAAVASFVVSQTGAELDPWAANTLTSAGALGFLVAAVLLMGEGASPRRG